MRVSLSLLCLVFFLQQLVKANSLVFEKREVYFVRINVPSNKSDKRSGVNKVKLKVEVADTPDKHARGLMFRNHLGENEGMLFIFPTEETRNFWMKNTTLFPI